MDCTHGIGMRQVVGIMYQLKGELAIVIWRTGQTYTNPCSCDIYTRQNIDANSNRSKLSDELIRSSETRSYATCP